MTDPLWVDPHWTTAYTVGDRVRNTYTNAAGTVTRVAVGRHLLVEWETPRWGGYPTRHHSELGLVRER